MKTIYIIALLILVTGCVSQQPHDKVLVVTTLFPLYEFAKEVGGDKADVILLLPPGTEPHTFDPKPSDAARIASADIFVYIGAEMEPWAKDILDGTPNPERLVVRASSQVTLISADQQSVQSLAEMSNASYDPHIWLDFSDDVKIVDAITAVYADKDPMNKDYYLANAAKYNEKLQTLDEEYTQGLSSCKTREFITGGHHAYAYLAKRYGLQFVSAYGLSPDSEPTPKTIKAIDDLAKAHGIKVIFFEELVSPRLAQAIAEQTGAITMVLNPGHNIGIAELRNGTTFISLMQNNLESLRTALECT